MKSLPCFTKLATGKGEGMRGEYQGGPGEERGRGQGDYEGEKGGEGEMTLSFCR